MKCKHDLLDSVAQAIYPGIGPISFTHSVYAPRLDLENRPPLATDVRCEMMATSICLEMMATSIFHCSSQSPVIPTWSAMFDGSTRFSDDPVGMNDAG